MFARERSTNSPEETAGKSPRKTKSISDSKRTSKRLAEKAKSAFPRRFRERFFLNFPVAELRENASAISRQESTNTRRRAISRSQTRTANFLSKAKSRAPPKSCDHAFPRRGRKRLKFRFAFPRRRFLRRRKECPAQARSLIRRKRSETRLSKRNPFKIAFPRRFF